MKLHTAMGTNPAIVDRFMRAKTMDLELVTVDVAAGEHKEPPYLARNPTGQIPTLELDDGKHVSQILAICEYLEEIQPDPPLIGTTAQERAETRMWLRRIDLNIAEPMTLAFKGSEGLIWFQHSTRCLPEAANGLKALVQDNLAWLDAQMVGRDTVCAGRFTLADIMLYSFLAFGNGFGQPLSPAFANLNRLFSNAAQRLGERVDA